MALKRFFRRAKWDAERSRELDAHLEIETDENIARGMSPANARIAAQRKLGNRLAVTEEIYRFNSIPILETIVKDMGYALRVFGRNKSWTAVAVLSLALGIGANTALFSAANGLLLAKLSVDNPDELVTLGWSGDNPEARGMSSYGYWAGAGDLGLTGSFSYAAFQQLGRASMTLSDVFAFAPDSGHSEIRVAAGGTTERARMQFVSGNYYRALGIPAQLGRTIVTEDESAAAPVAVISAEYWRRRFGEDPSIIGTSVLVNSRPLSIVGVVPPGLGDMLRPGRQSYDIAIPVTTERVLFNNESRLLDASSWRLLVMGRMAPGAGIAQVQAELGAVFDAVVGTPEPADANRERAIFSVRSGNRGVYDARPEEALGLAVFAAVFGIVLIIACANLVTLLLFRGEARQREIAVQLAIGASRRRLIRQLLTESLIVALLGGGTGFLFAFGGLRLLRHIEMAAFGVDVPAFAFAMGLSLSTGLLAGLTPALRTTRLGELGLRTESSRDLTRSWLGKSIVAVQVALSVLLLVCAGLFVRTLINLQTVPLGFNAENLVFFNLNLSARSDGPEQIAALHEEILEGLRSLPGVQEATLASQPLMTGRVSANRITLDDGASAQVAGLTVHPGYFQTMEIPLLSGQPFVMEHYQIPRLSVIVNETFARRFFGGEDPVGRTLPFTSALSVDPIPIIGVVGDTTYSNLRETAWPIWYTPHRRASGRQAAFFHVRTNGDPASAIVAIREAVRAVDPALPNITVRTQETELEQDYRSEWVFATASFGFAVLALIVSMIGVFGLMSYAVTRRTKEIGIRMAIGADKFKILQDVFRESILLAGLGIVLGFAAATVATRFIESMLFGVAPSDPATIVSVLIAMLAVAAMAAYLPARRASRIDPMVALRHE